METKRTAKKKWRKKKKKEECHHSQNSYCLLFFATCLLNLLNLEPIICLSIRFDSICARDYSKKLGQYDKFVPMHATTSRITAQYTAPFVLTVLNTFFYFFSYLFIANIV